MTAPAQTMTIAASRQITLTTPTNEMIMIASEVAIPYSKIIASCCEDFSADDACVLPIPNCTKATLERIGQFYEACHVAKNSSAPEDMPPAEWLAQFVVMPQEELFDLILAANFLDSKILLDIGCQAVADMIKGKTPQEIRDHFNIPNDFTPEEEEEVRRENAWCEEVPVPI